MVRPFNGIGMFYGRFVKDFSTHMSFVGYVVIKVIVTPCSHVCAHVLKLLEQLRGTYFDKFLMLIDIMFYKIHVVLYKVHMSCVEHTLHAMHNSFWSHSSHNNDHFFKVLEQLSKHHVDNLDSILGMIPCKLQENNLKIEVSFVLIAKFNFECDGGSWFVDCDCENHLLVSEMSFGFQSEINLLYGTMIFDLDSLDFVGVLDRDLRTNPSKEGGDDVNPGVLKKNRRTGFEDKSFHKEGEDDVNPGIHNHRIQRCRGPWVDWGSRRGWRHDKEPSRIQRSDSNWNFTMKIKSKSSPKTTIVFIVEIASREYLARLNRISDEEAMVVLRKPRNAEQNARAGVLPHENARSGVCAERSIFCPETSPARAK